jgi:hypothetical protein
MNTEFRDLHVTDHLHIDLIEHQRALAGHKE